MLVALLLSALDLLLVYPAVLGGRVLGPEDFLFFNAPLSSVRPTSLMHPSNYLLTDALEVFHPDLEWARGIVRSGHLPLWNPQIFGGWPQFAAQQTALLYPLTWLAYALPFWPAISLIVVLKTLLAGLGTWWLCRRLGLGVAAALLAAVTYSLSSYFVIWLEHPHTNVYALIPWLLGAIDLVSVRRRVSDAGVLAAVVGLCLLGGHPESTFIAGLAAAGFAVVRLSEVTTAAERRRVLLLMAGAVVLGVASGAVVLVPFADLAAQAPRLARGGGAGQPDRSLLSLVLPDLWGRPDSPFQLTGPSNYAERTSYVGALALMLAVAGLYRARSRQQRFFVGLLVGALVVSIHVPVLTKAIVSLPVMSLVALNRALILVALSLAVLAGYGLQHLLDADVRERRLMLALAAAVACLPLLWLTRHAPAPGGLVRFSDIAPHLWGKSTTQAQTGAAALTRWLTFSMIGLGVLWLLTRSVNDGRRRLTAVALALTVGLAAADLLALNHGYHPAISQAEAAPAPTPSLVAARAAQGAGRTLGFNEYLIPNVGSRYGLREPRGHGLPALGRYLALWNGLGGTGFQDTRLRPKTPRAAQLLDDFGVTVLLTSRNEYAPVAPGIRRIARNRDGKIYRNANALPRAYLATSWRPAASRRAALAATLASPAARLRSAPVLEGVGLGPPIPALPGPSPSGVTFTEDAADTVALNVDAPRRGYVVLLDTYYPGWSATVDGRDATIHPANEAFRAVGVPAGRHRVVFRFLPRSLVGAAILSTVAWMVIFALAVLPRMRRRRPRTRPAAATPAAS
ncbi:MAG: hypothetical protein QOF77_1224 [Solirubrobacteraceae bacterium]|nr:hypothetical protein [Solirubrobacteraceae bacterium]